MKITDIIVLNHEVEKANEITAEDDKFTIESKLDEIDQLAALATKEYEELMDRVQREYDNLLDILDIFK